MTDQSNQKPLKRGALANLTGCNLETIRYYEKIKLMLPPDRTTSGHRIYSISDQSRLRFILRCRELGFSIEEIRSLLSLVDTGNYSCNEINTLTRLHLTSISKKINDLKKMQQTLQTISQECSNGDTPDCPIIDALSA
ncbi:MAG: transcriptional regulator [Alphaproteobacteria bacterium]|nr:MAG: transcriptional regulator [Alphaproteobacteria bacterium]